MAVMSGEEMNEGIIRRTVMSRTLFKPVSPFCLSSFSQETESRRLAASSTSAPRRQTGRCRPISEDLTMVHQAAAAHSLQVHELAFYALLRREGLLLESAVPLQRHERSLVPSFGARGHRSERLGFLLRLHTHGVTCHTRGYARASGGELWQAVRVDGSRFVVLLGGALALSCASCARTAWSSRSMGMLAIVRACSIVRATRDRNAHHRGSETSWIGHGKCACCVGRVPAGLPRGWRAPQPPAHCA